MSTSVKMRRSPAFMLGLTTRWESHVGRYGTLALCAAATVRRSMQQGYM